MNIPVILDPTVAANTFEFDMPDGSVRVLTRTATQEIMEAAKTATQIRVDAELFDNANQFQTRHERN